jgi:hypothetical protein
MTAYVLGVLIFAAILLLLALSKSGRSRLHEQPALKSTASFASRVRTVLASLGLVVEQFDQRGSVTDLVLMDPRPLIGGRSLARIYSGPDPVAADEVQTAMDSLQGESFHKILIFSAAGFRPEARTQALGGPAELVDPHRLGALATHLEGERTPAGALEDLVRPPA